MTGSEGDGARTGTLAPDAPPVPAEVDVLSVDPERRPVDAARLAVGIVVAVLCGMWAQTGNDLDGKLAAAVNGLPDAFEGIAKAFAALGSIWCVAIVVLVLLLGRRLPAARDTALAGVAGWLLAVGFHELLGQRSVSGLGITVRVGDGPSFPAASVVVATALVGALVPYLPAPRRKLCWVLVVPVALAALYLGTGLSSDVLGGFGVGIAIAAVVHLAFGAPGGRPTPTAIASALADLGLPVTEVRLSALTVERATVLEATLASGADVRVVAVGRDQRDSQFVERLWRKLAYKEPGVPAFGSRLLEVEHMAYCLLLAHDAGVRVPKLVRTAVAGPDAAVLVTEHATGRTLADVLTERGDDALDDALLASLWHEVTTLHAAGIAHGNVGPGRILVDDSGAVGFVDLASADTSGDPFWINRDVAALLALSAVHAGTDRAVAAAVAAVGADSLAAAIPLVQSASLPKGAIRGLAHPNKALKALRSAAATGAGVEDIAPLKVKRLSLVNLGMLAGVLLALAIAIPSIEGIDWQTVQSEFEHATWGFAVFAFICYPLVPSAWATALLGCVRDDLPFLPTVLTQLACTFLNLITPNGIGGTALQLDYLHHQGVPVASGASAMVLSTGVGGAIQMILFLGAAALTSTKVDTSNSGGSTVTLGAIALGAALVGVILWIPKIRDKVVPQVKRAASDIWAVLRNPKKGAQLIGGDLAGNLVYPALLGLCLLAFHQHLSFLQLIVVQVGAGMLGNVAPVPGGIGVQEAALTAGLTAFGIAPAPALAAVLVFRTITFAIPPIFGFFTLHALRRRGYA